jgi:hypothetical protein
MEEKIGKMKREMRRRKKLIEELWKLCHEKVRGKEDEEIELVHTSVLKLPSILRQQLFGGLQALEFPILILQAGS